MVDGGKEDLWGRLLLRMSTRQLLLRVMGGRGVRLPMQLLQRMLVGACLTGEVPLVSMLLDLCPPLEEMDWTGAGDDDRYPSSMGRTPLMAACAGSFNVVELLVRGGHVTRGMLEEKHDADGM